MTNELGVFLKYVPAVVFGMALLGFIYALLTRKPRDPKETMANMGIWAGNQILKATLTGGAMYLILTPFSAIAPWHLPDTPWVFALALLVADFSYYWQHRMAHQIRFFWAFHSVHHSSKEFNLSTAIRLPWFGVFASAIYYIPAVLLGFSPRHLFAGYMLVLLYQYWIHTESIGRLGWFEGVFNTPSNHRVHHGSNLRYLDRNHGGILIIWDRLFGTYQREEAAEPVIYGLTKPLNSYNPIRINFDEPYRLWQDMRKASSFKEAMSYLVRSPDWRPSATVAVGKVDARLSQGLS